MSSQPDAPPPRAYPWRGVIAVEGKDTVDGRRIRPGALTFQRPPLTLMNMAGTQHAVGRVDDIARDGHLIIASGVTNLEPGDYPAGMDVVNPDAITDGPAIIMTKGEVCAVYVRCAAAWDEAVITVGLVGAIDGVLVIPT